MQRFEYKVVPAPRRGEKTKVARTTPDRFAHTLTVLMNDLGREGWEYLRADTLPCEERVGLTGRSTQFQNMLVFRRTLTDTDAVAEVQAEVLVAAQPEAAASLPPETMRPAPLVLAPGGAAPALGPARNGVAAG